MKQTILYIDDEEDNLTVFKVIFRHDYTVITASDAKQGLYIARQTPVDLVVSDYKMPTTNGVDFLKEMSIEFPELNRILLTAYNENDLIIKSINEAKVFAFVTKPWKKEELKTLMDNALANSELKKQNRSLIEHLTLSNQQLQKANKENEGLRQLLDLENSYLKKEIEIEKGLGSMVGTSRLIKDVQANIEKVAKVNTTVLIQGQTGTGKELIARAIHGQSLRSAKPFVKLNCASLPIALVESELFGYEKGAFTGARQSKPGLFEVANQGTIFLDEIGELPLEVQPKLLRVLQEGEFYKIGSSKPISVDVRVLAATNRMLENEVKEARFRSDLFYRLNIFPIKVPDLKDRIEDIPALVEHFIHKYQRKLGINISHVPNKTMERLMSYPWPGNIRELESIIERSMIISQSGALEVHKLDIETSVITHDETILSLQEMEKEYIKKALAKANGKIAGSNGAAELLKVNHNTLRTRMIKLGIDFQSN
jgi:formate hydrogenlyase transcriptional activator